MAQSQRPRFRVWQLVLLSAAGTALVVGVIMELNNVPTGVYLVGIGAILTLIVSLTNLLRGSRGPRNNR